MAQRLVPVDANRKDWPRLVANAVNSLINTSAAAAAPSWALISSQTVAGSSVASVSFTSIPGSYNDLIFICRARGSAASAASNLQIRVNGDTAANYDYCAVNGNGTAVAFITGVAQTAMRVGAVSAASSVNSNRFGSVTVEIIQYANASFEKDVIAHSWDNASHTTAAFRRQETGGTWRSASAITRVDFLMDSGNIDVGSTFYLYGRS